MTSQPNCTDWGAPNPKELLQSCLQTASHMAGVPKVSWFLLHLWILLPTNVPTAVVIFQPFVQCLQIPLPCSLDPWHSCRWSKSAPRHISVSEACSCTTLYITYPFWMTSTPLSINSSASDCMGVCGPLWKTSRVVRDLKDASLRGESVNRGDPANCFTLGLTCHKKFW